MSDTSGSIKPGDRDPMAGDSVLRLLGRQETRQTDPVEQGRSVEMRLEWRIREVGVLW